MIQGHGLSYAVETDFIYNTGAMAQLYQDVGTGFLRCFGYCQLEMVTGRYRLDVDSEQRTMEGFNMGRDNVEMSDE